MKGSGDEMKAPDLNAEDRGGAAQVEAIQPVVDPIKTLKDSEGLQQQGDNIAEVCLLLGHAFHDNFMPVTLRLFSGPHSRCKNCHTAEVSSALESGLQIGDQLCVLSPKPSNAFLQNLLYLRAQTLD